MSQAPPTLQPLDAAPISHTISVPSDPASEPDALALPDAPAVCVFESAESPARTILIATTASARDLVRRRLGLVLPAAPEPLRSARPDLRSLCAGGRIHAIAIGSSLEADAVYLRQARERLPHLAKVVAERWRAWFVHVDFDAEFPQWTKTNLQVGLVGKRSASTAIGPGHLPPGVVLGPIPDKDAAGRLIESVIDVFDLCRYHHLLVLAPHAAACAYKEMGRCPAPCDGSEPMEVYRDRTTSAAVAITYGISGSIERTEHAIRSAAADEEFEKAARLQKAVARLRTLDKPAFAQVRPLHAWQELLILPSATRTHAAVALFDRGALFRVADIDPADPHAAESACRRAEAFLATAPPAERSTPLNLTPQAIDTIALVSRWLFLAKTKRKGDVVRLADGRFSADHTQHIAASLVRSKKPAAEIEGQEIEGAG